MTPNGAVEGRTIKGAQIVQWGSLLLLAVAVSVVLAFGRHNGIVVGVVLALFTVLAPAVHIMTRRRTEKVRLRETESRLVMHTRTYLSTQESASAAAARRVAPTESDIEILARVIDGSKLPTQDFRSYMGVARRPPEPELVVFDSMPRLYATRTYYERHFAALSSELPEPLPDETDDTPADVAEVAA